MSTAILSIAKHFELKSCLGMATSWSFDSNAILIGTSENIAADCFLVGCRNLIY